VYDLLAALFLVCMLDMHTSQTFITCYLNSQFDYEFSSLLPHYMSKSNLNFTYDLVLELGEMLSYHLDSLSANMNLFSV